MRATDQDDKHRRSRLANSIGGVAFTVGCLLLAWVQPDAARWYMGAALIGMGAVDLKTLKSLLPK